MRFDEFIRSQNNDKLFLIAEAGVNHENSLEKAKKMISLAAKAGCSSIKFQSYKATQLASKKAKSYWDTNSESEKSQFQLFSKYDKFDFKDYLKLKEYCDKKNIEFSTTVFDHKEISKYSEILNFFKIASADITNKPLIEAIAKEQKPVIMSTGAASIGEIETVVNYFKEKRIPVTILHCVLNYPCEPINASLKKIRYLKKVFPDNIIGYSDHVPTINGNLHLHVARLMGAQVIEKHFTLNKDLKGNDHYHSFDYNDIISYRNEEKFIYDLLNDSFLDIKNQKSAIKNARRSIVAKKTIEKNELIDLSNIEIKRPGTGISPKYIKYIVGLKTTKKIAEDEPIKWDDFK
tara:strand:+ start:702 stop:1745 length:1044 start_codon:yes stop_codon:yes gene_type:complete